MKRFSLLVLVALVFSVPSFAQDLVDNPVYQQWAKFKVGDTVKYKQLTEMMDNKTESEVVYTLTELTPEKAVVTMGSVTEVMGTKSEMPKTPIEYAAKTPKVDVGTVEGAANTEGDEEITVPAGTFKCHWIETTIKNADSETVSKVYTSDQVPGGLIKSVTTMEKPMKSVTSIELIAK